VNGGSLLRDESELGIISMLRFETKARKLPHEVTSCRHRRDACNYCAGSGVCHAARQSSRHRAGNAQETDPGDNQMQQRVELQRPHREMRGAGRQVDSRGL
jgi:hypothetical protein